MRLRYGCNPHQEFCTAEPIGADGPIELLSGQPSLINLLDVLNAWQLVRELRQATGKAAATSFKHVSPAGAAIAEPLSPELARAYEVFGRDLSDSALAYVRARNADPKSSFGDVIGLSDPVDETTAKYIWGVYSDGLVAPDFTPEALEILSKKKKGRFVVFKANPDFEPPPRESREVFGVTLTQDRNHREISDEDLRNVVCGESSPSAVRDLLVGLITVKYTQSNSVGYSLDGQMIGVGAGQQSRVDCTKIGGAKADVWFLRQHPKVVGLPFRDDTKKQERINWRVRYIEGDMVEIERRQFREALSEDVEPLSDEDKREWLTRLEGVSFVSDGLLPFRDNLDQAQRHGVTYVAQPCGSVRDDEIVASCADHGITMYRTDLRLFHH